VKLVRTLIVIFTFVLLVAGSQPASAHQPHYEGDQRVVVVTDPEISKAFYGALSGAPVRFQIDAPRQFSLYVNLLVPDVPGVRTDLALQIRDAQGRTVGTLDGKLGTWERWYEDFARDWYLKGPEFMTALPAGTYSMTLSNGENVGTYVVAIGEKESFPPSSIPEVLAQLVAVKTNVFAKPWYSAFVNVFGLGLIATMFIVTALGVGLGVAVRRIVLQIHRVTN
jgi:hypothetical protein